MSGTFAECVQFCEGAAGVAKGVIAEIAEFPECVAEISTDLYECIESCLVREESLPQDGRAANFADVSITATGVGATVATGLWRGSETASDCCCRCSRPVSDDTYQREREVNHRSTGWQKLATFSGIIAVPLFVGINALIVAGAPLWVTVGIVAVVVGGIGYALWAVFN